MFTVVNTAPHTLHNHSNYAKYTSQILITKFRGRKLTFAILQNICRQVSCSCKSRLLYTMLKKKKKRENEGNYCEMGRRVLMSWFMREGIAIRCIKVPLPRKYQTYFETKLFIVAQLHCFAVAALPWNFHLLPYRCWKTNLCSEGAALERKFFLPWKKKKKKKAV